MQYALIALGEHHILVDACEVSVLNAWREHPITERDEDVIGNIAGASTFAVTAFLRVHDWDVATNILNRAGLYALNGVERRHKQPVDKTNWEQCIDAERANRIARRLLKYGNHK
ncbi:hypothetical protein JRK10_004920 [Salmonella enterica]|nr:hypothetical protein [Salmonella enterica]